jgi:hypothetical protein
MQLNSDAPDVTPTAEVTLPLIHSKKPGSLDLSNYDFDELLGCAESPQGLKPDSFLRVSRHD